MRTRASAARYHRCAECQSAFDTVERLNACRLWLMFQPRGNCCRSLASVSGLGFRVDHDMKGLCNRPIALYTFACMYTHTNKQEHACLHTSILTYMHTRHGYTHARTKVRLYVHLTTPVAAPLLTATSRINEPWILRPTSYTAGI